MAAGVDVKDLFPDCFSSCFFRGKGCLISPDKQRLAECL